jgi:hypothetical protein
MDATSIDQPSTPSITDDMPVRTEADFLEKAELARSALQQFIVVKDFANANDVKRGAIVQVIDAIVSLFSLFSHFFIISFSSLVTFQ